METAKASAHPVSQSVVFLIRATVMTKQYPGRPFPGLNVSAEVLE
jgi:hypothetical protein